MKLVALLVTVATGISLWPRDADAFWWMMMQPPAQERPEPKVKNVYLYPRPRPEGLNLAAIKKSDPAKFQRFKAAYRVLRPLTSITFVPRNAEVDGKSYNFRGSFKKEGNVRTFTDLKFPLTPLAAKAAMAIAGGNLNQGELKELRRDARAMRLSMRSEEGHSGVVTANGLKQALAALDGDRASLIRVKRSGWPSDLVAARLVEIARQAQATPKR